MPYRAWERTRLPLVRGMREDIDPRVVPEGTFKSLRNMEFSKTGKLVAAREYSPVSGTTGFDDTFSSADPALGTPSRIYSLGAQQLVADSWLRVHDTSASRYKTAGPLPPLRMEPPISVMRRGDSVTAFAQDSDCAYSNGYLVTVYNIAGSLYGSVVHYATGTTLIDEELIVTPSGEMAGPMVLAGSNQVVVFWGDDGDASVNYSIIGTSTSLIDNGFGTPVQLVTDCISDHASFPLFDVTRSGTTASPTWLLAYAKDDGSTFEGVRVVEYSNAFVATGDAYEVDLNVNLKGVAILGEVNDANIWLVHSDDTNGLFVRLLDQDLALDANFPRTLVSGANETENPAIARLGADLSSVLIAWAHDLDRQTGTRQVGVTGLNIQNDAGSASLTPTLYYGVVHAARPVAVSSSEVLMPVLMEQGDTSSLPQDRAAALLSVVDTDGAVRDRPFPVSYMARGTAFIRRVGVRPPPHMIRIGSDVEWGYPQPLKLRLTDAADANTVGIDFYRWRYPSGVLLTEDTSRLPATFNDSLVLSGALVGHYDGRQIVDFGFAMRPFVVASHFTATATTGDIEQGQYQYIIVREWVDATGKRHQSAPSDAITVDLSATTYASNNAIVTVRVPPLRVGLKTTPDNTSRPEWTAVYRTKVGPQQTFFRIATSGAKWPENDPTSSTFATVTDRNADADIEDNEVFYFSQGVLAHEPPPPAQHVITHGDRLFLISAEDRSSIWFSSPVTEGDAAFFAGAWRIIVSDHGDLTALASLDGKVYAFTRSAIFLAAWGDGPSQTNAGSAFPLPQLLSTAAGCSDPRSIVVGPDGVFFAGDYENETMLFLWQRGDSGVVPIAEQIRDEIQDFPIITSAALIQERSQIRWTATNDSTGDSALLVYDYSERGEDGFGTWYVWDAVTGLAIGGGNWARAHRYCTTAGRVVGEASGPTTQTDKTATLGHLWPAGLMTPARLKAVNVLGSVVSSSSASGKPTVSVEYSYDGGSTFTGTNTFSMAGDAGEQFVKRAQPRRQRLTAGDIVLRLRLSNGDTSTDEVALNALMIESNPDGNGPRLGSGSRD